MERETSLIREFFTDHTKTETRLVILQLNELMHANNADGITDYIRELNEAGEIEVGIFGPGGSPAFGSKMQLPDARFAPRAGEAIHLDGKLVFSRPIRNEKRCHACHSPEDENRGTVVIKHSAVRMEQEIRTTVRNILLFALFLGITSEIFLLVILKKMVLGPIGALNKGARMLKEGRLDYRIEKNADDEIGSLVSCFNEMAESLEHSRANLENAVRQRTKELGIAAELTTHMLRADTHLSVSTKHFLTAITKNLGYRLAALVLVDRETGRLVQEQKQGTDADIFDFDISLASNHPFIEAAREARTTVIKASEIKAPDHLGTFVIIPIVSRQRNRCSDINLCALEDCPAYQNADDRCWLIQDTLCRSPLAVAGKEKIYGCVHCPAFPVLGMLIAGREDAVTKTSLHSLEIIASEMTTAIENQRFAEGKKKTIDNLIRLHDISVDALQTLDPDALNRAIISSAAAFAHMDAVVLWLKGHDGRLCPEAAAGIDSTCLPCQIDADTTFIGRALRENRIIETVKIAEVVCLHDFLKQAGFLYVASLPLYHKDDLYGCLVLLRKRDFFMTDPEKAIMQLFSSQAAAAIHTARMYKSLFESEERYRGLINSAQDAIFTISSSGRLTSLNPAFETITGWPCGEWIGKFFIPLVHPDDRSPALGIFRQVLKGGPQPLFELRILCKGGSYVTAEFKIVMRFTRDDTIHIIGIGRDVTARKRLEEERTILISGLNEQKELSEAIFNTMTMGVMVLDRDGLIMRLNRAGADILKIDPKEVGAARITDLYPDLSAFLLTSHEIGRETVLLTGGRIIPIGFTNSPLLGPDGLQQGIVVVFRDLTEIRKLQAEVQRREHYAAVGKVLFGIAHEIRNPLFGISSIAQILEQEVTSPQHLAMIQAVLRESDRMNHLMEELLLYARPSRLDIQDISLTRLMEEIRYSIRGKRSGIGITEQIPAGFMIRADADKIKQVLLNLIDNAVEAARSSVTISACTVNGSIEISIADDGPGIPEENREKIFEPFFTTKKRGTGLGLPISKKIINDHGGTLEVDSSGEGRSTMTITLSA